MIPYVYGRCVRLHFANKKILTPQGVMIHDPSGIYWPKCSLVIMTVGRGSRAATDEEYDGAPKHYLGRQHKPRIVSVQFPEKTGWKKVGTLTRIDYVRGGTKAPGGYRHYINKPRGVYRVTHLLKGGDAEVMVSKLGRMYRVDFPSACIIDDRGIVYP